MSTRDQVGGPAVEKPSSLQAPGRLHVETWAGPDGGPSLAISQVVVEIMWEVCGFGDLPSPPPLLSSVSPGPGREVRNRMGWSLMEKTARSGGVVVPGCLVQEQCSFCICCICKLGKERIVPYSVVGPPTFVVFLFIFVWARHGCRATIWRAVLTAAC